MSKTADQTIGQSVIGAATKAAPSKLSSGLIWWRRLMQTAGLLILGQWSYYGIFRCPFVVPYVSCQNCPVITCHGRLLTIFWGFWLILPVSVLLFGRAFCGWACPGGTVNRLFGKLAPIKLKKTSFIRVAAPYGKYIGLLVAIYGWQVLAQPRIAIPIRVGDFFASTGLTFEHADNLWMIRTVFVLIFMAAGLLLSAAWCRFACPTGGLLEIFKRFSLFKIYKTDDCNDCNKCLNLCTMATRPAESNCTNCGDCLSCCPVDAIKIGKRP